MEIKVEKEAFLKILAQTANATNPKASPPILSNVLLEATAGVVCLTGTDLELGIRAQCDAVVAQEGTVAVPAKKLHDIVREFPPGELEITVGKNNAVNIKTKKSFVKIVGLEPGDFPKPPNLKPEQVFELDQTTLKRCLGLTVFAISRDETRYTLNGVLVVTKKGKTRFVATDGKRLAMVEREAENTEHNAELELILPLKTVFELTKTLTDEGKIRVLIAQNQIQFETTTTLITSRLIEGKFPNYEHVIPGTAKTTARVDRQELLAAIKRAALLTSQENQSVKIDFLKGRVLISSRSPNVGEAKEELGAETTGEDLSIGFNPAYLIDVLKNLERETVLLSMTEPDKPGLVKGDEDYTYVVMPMQLN